MFTLRVLSREVTEKVLKLSDVISTVEEVYRLKAMGETAVFPLVFHEFEPGVADMDIKSGWLKGKRKEESPGADWYCFSDGCKDGRAAGNPGRQSYYRNQNRRGRRNRRKAAGKKGF